MQILFYTLFHIRNDKKIESHNGHADINIYLGCINTLGRTLHLSGQKLIVLTNDQNRIRGSINTYIDIEEMDFSQIVPLDINFYSAHYKIEVFNHLSKKKSHYSILVDSDVFCQTDLPYVLKLAAINSLPICYEISDQVFPAYGHEIM